MPEFLFLKLASIFVAFQLLELLILGRKTQVFGLQRQEPLGHVMRQTPLFVSHVVHGLQMHFVLVPLTVPHVAIVDS